jgi:hypothetical protein
LLPRQLFGHPAAMDDGAFFVFENVAAIFQVSAAPRNFLSVSLRATDPFHLTVAGRHNWYSAGLD